jgi:predicted nucleic acid-binding protein
VIACVDTSAVLRLALGEPGASTAWLGAEYALASRLCEIEALRTLDRQRTRAVLGDAGMAEARARVLDLLGRLTLVPMSAAILERAAAPFPTTLGTLDAIHLSTALVWTAATGDALTFVTHDGQLALAARSCGLDVIG